MNWQSAPAIHEYCASPVPARQSQAAPAATMVRASLPVNPLQIDPPHCIVSRSSPVPVPCAARTIEAADTPFTDPAEQDVPDSQVISKLRLDPPTAHISSAVHRQIRCRNWHREQNLRRFSRSSYRSEFAEYKPRHQIIGSGRHSAWP